MEALNSAKSITDQNGKPWHQTMDGSLWAKAYCAMYGGDEQMMLGWFCNAIMAGWDHRQWQLDRDARAALEAVPATPAPVLVAERPWERDGWLDTDGKCWLQFIGSTTIAWQYKDFDPDLLLSEFADIYPRMLPHWALPLPEAQP